MAIPLEIVDKMPKTYYNTPCYKIFKKDWSDFMSNALMVIPEKKKHLIIKILLILIVAIIIFILTTIISFNCYIDNKLNKINYVGINKDEITINNGINSQISTYRNIALLGLDTREDTYNGSRSDGIMIISINESNNDVKITSVYRDTYLDIKNNNSNNIFLDKITHAYAYGGAKLSMNALNRNLDLNITEFVAVNFSAVVEVVNSIGGISIEVDVSEVKYINRYIDNINKITGSTSAHIKKAGTYNLDGVQALAYCRIRYTEGGDYKRTERMREVIIATFEKAKTLNVADLNNLADIILPHISTNIDKNSIRDSISKVTQYNVSQNAGFPYEVKDATIGGIWYGIPVNLENDVSKLHYNLFGTENYVPSETVKNISAKILEKQ